MAVVGVVARVGVGFGSVARDRNVVAVVAAVVDRGTGRVQGSGPGC